MAGKETAAWEFHGWSTAERIRDLGNGPVSITRLDTSAPRKLGEWNATGICGNDITSSSLYVAALCSLYAGPYAPCPSWAFMWWAVAIFNL